MVGTGDTLRPASDTGRRDQRRRAALRLAMNLSWIPNAITIARMVMALPLLWLLVNGHYPQAFWLALVAGASDALDGLLAQRFGWRSALGGLLDPIADKLLMSVCFLGLWWSWQFADLAGWPWCWSAIS